MTQYFLHGGIAGKKSHKNKVFWNDFLSDYKQGDRILCIAFAKTKGNYISEDFQKMVHSFVDFTIDSELASENNKILIEQIKNSRYIYIYIVGGDHNSLLLGMEFLKNHKNIFEGKIIAGSSAGTNIVSQISFSNDYQLIIPGLGLLNIGTMCHFKNEGIGKELLQKNTQDGELYFIPEEEYIFIEK